MDRERVLSLYDTPDPRSPGRTVPGYDREHARRTAQIVMKMAQEMGVRASLWEKLEVTALLHDVGRAGMDPQLFRAIFGAAREKGLPVRLPQLLEAYPEASGGKATATFLELVRPFLVERGIEVNEQVVDHISMRMDFKGRLRRVLDEKASRLQKMGIAIEPWMEKVMLYYYYPQEMAGQPAEVHLMGMILVASENFEAYNNRRRGRDYYGREKESLRDAFEVLAGFRERGLVSGQVVHALERLTARRELDGVIKEAQGFPANGPLSPADERFIQRLAQEQAQHQLTQSH